MKKSYLIVIDMQKDFITGSLGSKYGQDIVNNVKKKIEIYQGEILVTKDTHFENYLDTTEGKHLPVPHCIKGTKGWEIADGLYVEGAKIIDKPNFGWPHWDEETLECVELIGLCTDICVVYNALIIKATFPDAQVKVDSACCAGVTLESHEAALKTMQMCQVEVV